MESPLEHFFEQAARRAAHPDAHPDAHPEAAPHDLTVVLEPAPDATAELPVVPDEAPVREPLYGRADRRPPLPFAPPPAAAPPAAALPAPDLPAAPLPAPEWPAAARRPAPPEPRAAVPRGRATGGRVRPTGGRRPPVAALAAAGAVVLVAGAAVAGLRSDGDRDERATPASSAAPAAAAVRVPARAVRASASTTQRPDGAISYAPANTLDGRAGTAWNSRGQGAGAWLSYTFGAPVDLTSITVLNGYQKTRPGKDGGVVDLFALNERVRAVRVVTDGGSVEWTLRDDRAPQTLTRAFGTTRTVRLQVLSTYPSAKYDDLAVSEVRFTAR